MSNNQNTISWQAYEFRHYEKNYGWYVVWAAVSLLIIGYFALEKDFFAAICLTILSLFVYFFSRQKPGRIDISLTPKGIHYGNLLFPYKQIKQFWIVHNENHKTLNFHTTAILNNTIILELEEQDPEEVRQYLLNHVLEHTETGETPAQRLMHRIKF